MAQTHAWLEAETRLAARFADATASNDRDALLRELAAYAAAVVADARARGPIVPTREERVRQRAWVEHPVFICGHHRSGTTLLQELLDSHPQLVVLASEASYFTSFSDLARGASAPAVLDRFAREWIARFVDPNFAPHFRLGRSDEARQPSLEFTRRLIGWHDALETTAPKGFAALLALISAYASVVPSPAPRHWIEKTPLNELHVARLQVFRAAKFIHVVRDPMRTFASLRAAYERGGHTREFDACEHAAALGRSLRAAQRNASRLGASYLIVRYEDLVSNVSREMERVRGFLGIDAHAMLEVPTAGGVPVAANSSFDAAAPGLVRATSESKPLSASDLRHLGAFAAAAARAFGYDIAARPRLAGALHRFTHAPRLALRRAVHALARRMA
jgi:hypothetical protein